MTSRKYLTTPIEEREVECAFCGISEEKVSHMFIGSDNKGICITCVGYVREDMGLDEVKSPLDKFVDGYS